MRIFTIKKKKIEKENEKKERKKRKRERWNEYETYALVFQASIQISHSPMKMRNMYIPNDTITTITYKRENKKVK